MDHMRMLLHDEIAAPPGFVDGVMDAIEAHISVQTERQPVYTPAAKGILCIAAAVILLLLSMPKLDAAWAALADLSRGLHTAAVTNEIPDGDDGLCLPYGPVLNATNIH